MRDTSCHVIAEHSSSSLSRRRIGTAAARPDRYAQLCGDIPARRSTSTQTLVANQLFEDLADARFAALSYRFQASDEEADIVRRQISKILEAQQTTEQLFGDDPLALEKLQHAVASTTEFRDAFERIIVLQRDHDEIVDELEGIGPKIREGLTRILNFAYENGDTSAAYFAGIAQQRRPPILPASRSRNSCVGASIKNVFF